MALVYYFRLNIKDMLFKLKENNSKSLKAQFCLGMFLSCQSTFSVFVWTLVHISEYGCHPCAYKTSANTPKLTHLFNELVQRLKQEIFVASNLFLNVFVCVEQELVIALHSVAI